MKTVSRASCRAVPNDCRAILLGWIIAFVLIPSFVKAGELHFYEHNSSVISWFVVNDSITAKYEMPRPGLLEAGVKSGTVLFEGRYEGDKIIGTAYAYKAGCAPAPYHVVGEEKAGVISLRGPGPLRNSCEVRGYSLTSPHSNLVFKYSSTHH